MRTKRLGERIGPVRGAGRAQRSGVKKLRGSGLGVIHE